jgi:Zn/Cd-binding protein ZinT
MPCGVLTYSAAKMENSHKFQVVRENPKPNGGSTSTGYVAYSTHLIPPKKNKHQYKYITTIQPVCT